MTKPTFPSLNLNTTILSAIHDAGYHEPTEIQHRTIPKLLAGKDVLATAQTGTGKTAAFVLPMLQNLKRAEGTARRAMPTALVLAPTRELAVQIAESISTYSKGSRLQCAAIFGGASKSGQLTKLRSRPDIIVATPGRLLDFIDERAISLKSVMYLVLDEADRMLDMGFIPAIRRIVAMTPLERQTALFSATMPQAIRKLSGELLRNPVSIQAERGEMRVERIDQSVMYVDREDKFNLLSSIIQDRGMFRALVFTRTKYKASRVAKKLSKLNLPSDSLHGDKSQSARTRALDNFKKGKIQVLVATDVASRGIDVEDITHVVNFELPNEPETYVHRIGRTARAGSVGSAVSLCDETEVKHLRGIEKLIGVALTVDRDQPYHREQRR